MKKHCLVKGCTNASNQGTFVGDLCFPCHEMITTGIVHPANQTFIGVLAQRVRVYEDLGRQLEGVSHVDAPKTD